MKKTWYLTAVLFCAALFCFGLWFWILPDRAVSAEENRPLQGFPELRFSSLLSGDFSGELSTYYADQFPLRDAFVGAKAVLELSLGKGENNGILLGESGQLARRLFRLPGFISPTDAYDRDDLSKKTGILKEFCQKAELPVTVLLPPRAIDVASSAFSYPDQTSRAVISQLREELSEVGYRDLCEKLQSAYESGEAVWYKTDHHWTSLGAYYAYTEVMRSFGMEEEILPVDSFERRVVSTSFFGTLASASGMKFLSPDKVEIFLSGREEEYEVTADGKELSGLYAFDALAKKDHYAIFLDGTHDIVTIRKKNGESRPLLLVAKDSFANSMAPFLALHFDLILVNLSSTRREFTDLSALLDEYRPERLLLVYSVENLLTSDRILTLR
ncbi:MAG: hypothetical protein IJR88_04575 [Clostridia bacterium]|nr:hypothetical protein [Clostridia bacterium]